ncbi:MAG: pentapeptide repeat-containing protein [Chloroflexi bacterium]|nr:pentapeptide repeat-containing protein [Chloroflexota bacterium]
MSELTTEQVLELLQRQGGSQNVDLSGRDLTGIDLSGEALEELLEEQGYGNGSSRPPRWFEPWTKGVSLSHANLRRSHLRMADLRNACLEGADLRDADLAGAYLQEAMLEEADLRRANLAGAVLSHSVLWAKYSSLEGAYLYGAHVEFVPCRREQFGRGVGEELDRDWLRAREAYLALRHNFLDMGRYADSSWAYRKERRMERSAAFPSEEGDQWVKDELARPRGALTRWMPEELLRRLLYLRLYLKPPRGVPVRRAQHLGNWFEDALCEFGENPWRLLWWMGGLLVAFGLLYFLVDLLSPEPVTLALAAGSPRPLMEYLTFSLASLATVTFVRLEPATTLGALLASLEAALGLGLFALLMYTLGRRMSGN